LAEHANVRELVVNGWINLVVAHENQFFRYTENAEWQELHVGSTFGALNVA
jgi:hypothetical protein